MFRKKTRPVQQQAALITGASSGIGAEIAKQLDAKGHPVILVARRRDKLEQLASSLNNAYVLDCDLSNRRALNTVSGRAIELCQQHQLHLTILVNNAGIGIWQPFVQQELTNIQQEIDLNVTAVTSLSADFVAYAHQFTVEKKPASINKHQPYYILNIGSLASTLPTPRFSVYSATKAFVLRFSQILAYELRHSNISVTCSCPGGVLTEFMDHSGQALKNETGMMTSEDVARQSLAAMFAKKETVIPGMMNKLTLLSRVLPRHWQMKVIENSMKITVKEG